MISNKIILLVSFILSSIYFATPGPITKALPIFLLAVLSLSKNKQYGYLIGTGLIFSSIGDIFLELDDSNKDYFIAGLASFLVAHLLYIRAYLCSNLLYRHCLIVATAIVTYYAGMMSVLLPKVEQDLVYAIILYGFAIALMLFLGIIRFFSVSANSASRFNSLLGSIFFIVSDTVLAVNKFALPIHYAKEIIMITYYIGQTFIALSACEDQ